MALYGRVYTSDLTTPVFLDDFSLQIDNVTISWELHGGFRAAEVSLVCNSRKAYFYYRRFIGKRIVIDDQFCDRPVVDGFLTNATLTQDGINFTVSGFWFRHSDQYYIFDDTDWEYGLAPIGTYFRYNPTGQSIVDYGEGVGPSQDFSDWETTVAPAVYLIEVTNTDGTICWGFLGAAFTTYDANDSVYVYTDYGLATPGWNLTSVSGKTIASYVVLLVYDYKTTSDVIKEALTTETPSMSTNQNNIDDAEWPVGQYAPPAEEGGMYPAEFIEKVASFSDVSSNQWNYWVQHANYENGLPQKPLPFFKAQTNDGTYDWEIDSLVSAGGDVATRDMSELRNSLIVIFRDMENSDLVDYTPEVTDADSIATYWRRESITSGGDNTMASATHYGNLYINDYKDPVMGLPIEISGGKINDSYGRPCPLWFPIKYNKAYFRQIGLFPEYGVTNYNKDGVFTGQAQSMEYSYRDNSLRLTIDTESNELAAVIARMDAYS